MQTGSIHVRKFEKSFINESSETVQASQTTEGITFQNSQQSARLTYFLCNQENIVMVCLFWSHFHLNKPSSSIGKYKQATIVQLDTGIGGQPR